MKQILVISGKGGTGKTVLTASLAVLAGRQVVVDCDVDAADLHLLLHPRIRERHEFRSGRTAKIDPELCQACGACFDACRFGAIVKNVKFSIDPVSCEGCGLCSRLCPYRAIEMKENVCGEWFVSETKCGPLVHAKLGIAEENSGKLVSKIRQKALEIARQENVDYIIIDGPPGIGCPVLASLSGVDLAVIVTEPTLSGLHDARRVIEVARHFQITVNMIINKYDLNLEMTATIEKYCEDNQIILLGKIAFDKSIVQAMVHGRTIVDCQDGQTKEAVEGIFRKIEDGFKAIQSG